MYSLISVVDREISSTLLMQEPYFYHFREEQWNLVVLKQQNSILNDNMARHPSVYYNEIAILAPLIRICENFHRIIRIQTFNILLHVDNITS